MEFDYQFTKFLVLLVVVIGGIFTFRLLLKNEIERQFLYFGGLGVFVWSGIGGTLRMVEWKYLWFFSLFFLILFGTFTLTIRFLDKRMQPIRFFEGEGLLNEKFWKSGVFLFLAFSLFPLIYPEFQLMRLFNPPSPDLVYKIEENLKETGDTVPEIIFYYASALLFPFFLFSLAFLGRQYWWVFLAVMGHYYIRYCTDQYLPRHEIGLMLIMLFLYLWNLRIFTRKVLISSCVLGLPFLLFFFNVYTSLRLGSGVEIGFNFYGILESVLNLFFQETFYPIYVNDIIESTHENEILRYLKWIVSLPIPQNLTESWDYLQINHEFTELVTGQVYGQTTTHVYLPGLFGEGLFIFGNRLFWIHAISVGMLTGLLCFMLRNEVRLFFLMTFFQLQLLILARGGVSLLLILVVNYFLLFWPFFFILVRRSRIAARNMTIFRSTDYPEDPPDYLTQVNGPSANS